MKVKKVKPVAKKPKHFKSLIKVQFSIIYIDSDILGPLGHTDPLIHTFEVEGAIVQSLPKKFRLVMQLVAIPVRGKKTVALLMSPDIMGGGQLFHRPYTKAEIKKMRAEEAARIKKEAEEYRDYDD